MDLHLNLSGGLTGDMFIAAVLDAFPQLEQRVIDAIDALDTPYPVVCSLVAQSNDEVAGHRFEVEPFDKYFGHIPLAFPTEAASWGSVRERLISADIGDRIRAHAAKIFELIVRAESAAQGVLPEKVAFEAGAWNSLAQVVGAATLIDALDAARWSASPIPSGEKVTRVGAAIVDYLCPPASRGRPLPKVLSLARSGTGFGAFQQAIHLRLLCFESGDAALANRDNAPAPRREVPRSGQQTRQ